MNIKIAVFTLSLSSLLVPHDTFAGHISEFAPEEQEQIKRFYIVATGLDVSWQERNKESVFPKAREIIETVPQTVPNYGKTNFSITDLFTTTFDLQVEGNASIGIFYPIQKEGAHYLLDYFDRNLKDSEFFDHILNYIPNIDNIRDNKGRTILMKMANVLLRDGKENNDEVMLHCFSSLLNKGASLSVQDNEGHDALSIALLAHNTPMIRLIRAHLEQHTDIALSEHNKILLAIHQGEIITLDSPGETLLKDTYRVANQSKNYQMVNDMYNKFFGREKFFNEMKPAYYFHPPLWAYNISQMKGYAISRARELQAHIIEESQLKPVEEGLFEYNNGVQKVLLKKKASHDVGRILGRNHLGRVIQQMGLQNQLAVPLKFLTVPSGGLQHIEVVLKIPAGTIDVGLDMGGDQDNSMGIAMMGSTVYAEFIRTVPTSFKSLDNDSTVREVGEIAGFADYGHGNENFSLSTRDNKIYFIDTEDRKNFTQRWIEGPHIEAAVKFFCFDPRIKYVSIQLSPEDFK